MALHDLVLTFRQLRRWLRLPAGRTQPMVGTIEVAEARALADAEHAAGGVADGCAWLDDRTIVDVDLPRCFGPSTAR